MKWPILNERDDMHSLFFTKENSWNSKENNNSNLKEDTAVSECQVNKQLVVMLQGFLVPMPFMFNKM